MDRTVHRHNKGRTTGQDIDVAMEQRYTCRRDVIDRCHIITQKARILDASYGLARGSQLRKIDLTGWMEQVLDRDAQHLTVASRVTI